MPRLSDQELQEIIRYSARLMGREDVARTGVFV
jgi:hypothetical protein